MGSDLSDLSDLSESESEQPLGECSLAGMGGKHRKRNAAKRQHKRARVGDATSDKAPSAPPPSNSSGPKKRNRKRNQRRAARIEEHGRTTRPYAIKKAIQSAEFISMTDFDVENDRPSAKGAYTARIKKVVDSSQVYHLEDLLQLGFTHIQWDGR